MLLLLAVAATRGALPGPTLCVAAVRSALYVRILSLENLLAEIGVRNHHQLHLRGTSASHSYPTALHYFAANYVSSAPGQRPCGPTAVAAEVMPSPAAAAAAPRAQHFVARAPSPAPYHQVRTNGAKPAAAAVRVPY